MFLFNSDMSSESHLTSMAERLREHPLPQAAEKKKRGRKGKEPAHDPSM